VAEVAEVIEETVQNESVERQLESESMLDDGLASRSVLPSGALIPNGCAGCAGCAAAVAPPSRRLDADRRSLFLDAVDDDETVDAVDDVEALRCSFREARRSSRSWDSATS
jgi:hypothetical protein